ncbi:hypothetical protein V1477_005766 [Vespula maculifrons]|uniref:Uncharacterized protein n=1 Tax=Vespula maculifrons TaxID=7453 RepID=A0ABD2CLY1_VESMC
MENQSMLCLLKDYMQSKKVFLVISEFIPNIPNGMKPKLEHHVSLLQLTDKPAFQLVSAKKINQHVGLVNRQYHRKSKHGRYRVRWVKNPKRCAGYKYRRSEDGDEAAGHSFGDCRTSNTRASVRYTKPTEDESSTKRLDVLRYNKFNNAPPDNITLHIQSETHFH